MATEFVRQFHNLQGLTIGERRKNFFHLINTSSSFAQNPVILQEITETLKPADHQENLFFADFLIKFRQFRALFKMYITGNDIIVNKIRNEKWFFQQLYEDQKTGFVDSFLPTVSYSIRIKILRKLAVILNEDENEMIFNSLLERYGVFIACTVLIGCSGSKIEQVLKMFPVKLSTNELKVVYNKNPNLLYIYIEERVKHETNSAFLSNDPIIRFIAAKNPEMYCNLQEKYEIQHCKIGKHSTKKIVKLNSARILKKPKVYVENLNAGRLVRTLGNQNFEKLFFDTFPRDSDNAFYRWHPHLMLLKHFVKVHQLDLFQRTFEQIFCDSLADTSDQLDSYEFFLLLKINHNALERDKWVNRRYKQDKDEELFKYLTTDKCLQHFCNKSLITATHIDILTKSCLNNNDFESLLKIMKLIIERCKNEQSICDRFFGILIRKKALDKCNKNHWETLKNIFKDCHNVDGRLVLKLIEFELKTGEIDRNEVVLLLKKSNYLDYLHEAKISREVLLLLIEVAPNSLKLDQTIEVTDLQFLKVCKENYFVEVLSHDRLISSIQSLIESDDFENIETIISVISWIVCQDHPNSDNLRKVYWSKIDKLATKETLCWFLTYRPNFIIDNINSFINVMFSNQLKSFYWQWMRNDKIWFLIKSYTHLQVDKKISNHCVAQLQDTEDLEKLTKPLSIILSPKAYAKILIDAKPTILTLNELDPEQKKQFEFHRNLLKDCVHLNEPETLLEVILPYFTEDYVASCLSPIYSCLYRIPEVGLVPFLNRIASINAVSVKKHAFYLTCVTQSESKIFEMLQSCRLSQAIAMIYQYFVKNPTEKSWLILNDKLKNLDNNDQFTAMLLVNKLAPKLYKSRYFEAAFNVFKAKENRFTNVLIDKLDSDTIGHLSVQFFQNYNVFEMDKGEHIFSSYLLYAPDTVKFETIFNALITFKLHNWSIRSTECRTKLNKFVNKIVDLYNGLKKTDPAIIQTFLAGFKKIFKPIEAFEEFVLLSILSWKNFPTDEYIAALSDFHQRVVADFGKLSSKIVADCYNKKFYSDDVFQYCEIMLEKKRNDNDAYFVINVLPQSHPKLKKSAVCYYKVLRLLQKNESSTVKLYLNYRFTQKELRSALC